MSLPDLKFWNERYEEAFSSYGVEPNDFVKKVADRIPQGPVLVIAAGEGRDAVFLAERGHDVTAVDLSPIGLANAAKLAEARGVPLETITADLADYDFGDSQWAGIVAIWAHLPPALRREVHGACAKALRPGGVMVLEAYSPAQLQRPGVGGPPNAAMLMTPEDLKEELAGLEFEICHEIERDVEEGRYHNGPSTTTQVLALRP